MIDPYDFLWNYHFEREEETLSDMNRQFETEQKAKERYYENKCKNDRNELD